MECVWNVATRAYQIIHFKIKCHFIWFMRLRSKESKSFFLQSRFQRFSSNIGWNYIISAVCVLYREDKLMWLFFWFVVLVMLGMSHSRRRMIIIKSRMCLVRVYCFAVCCSLRRWQHRLIKYTHCLFCFIIMVVDVVDVFVVECVVEEDWSILDVIKRCKFRFGKTPLMSLTSTHTSLRTRLSSAS